MAGNIRRVLLRHALWISPEAFCVFSYKGVSKICCMSCDCAVVWEEVPQYWVCPDCGIELTPIEARYVLELGELSIQRAQADERLGVSWVLAKWWRRLWGRWILRKNPRLP